MAVMIESLLYFLAVGLIFIFLVWLLGKVLDS